VKNFFTLFTVETVQKLVTSVWLRFDASHNQKEIATFLWTTL